MQEVVEIIVQGLRVHLSILFFDGNDLVFGELYRARLMRIDVPGLHADHAFVGVQDGIDDGCVGLCAPREEEYLGFRVVTSSLYFLFGIVAIDVETV